MTLTQLYRETGNRLAESGISDAAQEAAVLMEHFLGVSRAGLILHGESSPEGSLAEALENAVAQRVLRRPLQYILGSWAFYGLSLAVGEGVLIPREDTAVLVEAACGYLQDKPKATGADLCAGTGAVALAVAQKNPGTAISAVELSEVALGYLNKNCRSYPDLAVKPLRGDILDSALQEQFPAQSLDFIVSNPPYIESGALPLLQPEVRREPALALDGGPDGLRFYRVLTADWCCRLKPGGLLAVEIGETQGQEVKQLFSENGLTQVQILKDMAGHDRVVRGIVPRK